MLRHTVNGRVLSLKYSDVSFKDKKTGADKEVKKCECAISVLDEKDIVYSIDFWGNAAYDYFIDISEGDPVVCAFTITSRAYNSRYYHSLKGLRIEKYLGKSMEEKILEPKEIDFNSVKSYADIEFEKSEYAKLVPEEKDADLPF